MAWWNRHRESPAFVPHRRDEHQKSVSFDLTSGPPPWQYQYGYGFLGDSYGGIYRKQPAVRTVVDFLSTNIGQLNLKVFGRIGDADRVELDGHPLAVLLRRPNPDTTKFRLFRDLVADQSIQDVAYWGKIRLQGRVRGLVRLPKSRINVEDVDGTVTYRNTRTHTVIPRQDLVIFPGYHPDGNPWGVSPMETLRQVLAEDWDATQHRRYFWKNAARRDGVIERGELAPEWSDVARARFRADWEATHSGAMNAGRTPVLEDGMHWVPDAFSPKESEYLEGRRLTSEEVARAYGIAPKLLGMGDDTNANIESFHRQLYQDVLGPRLVAIEQEIELQLLPDLDSTPASTGRVYVEFNLGEKLKASFEEEMKVLVTSTGAPIISINEARARQNLPALEGEEWEVPIKPMNVMYGGQPAPTVPTATPATPPTEMPGTPSTRADETVYAKAEIPPAVERRRQTAADDQTEALVRYFRRQEKAYFAMTARKADGLKATWDLDKWDQVLHEVLFSAAVPLAAQTGQRAARQIRGVYNEEQTTEFLAATTLSSAQNINAKTMADLIDANDPERALEIFAVAKGSRAEQLGLSQATGIINFARKEAAVQSQANDGWERMKTWVVTSRNSRHPELDGETVPVSENFSNGLAWPGDSAGDANETAGCHCLLNIDAEPGKAVVRAPLEMPAETKAEPVRDERPNFTINLPPPPELKMPNFRVDVRMPSPADPAPIYVESPTVNFHAPEQNAPDVKVYVESATVNVEPTPVNIQPADISVNIEPQDVHVAAPTVHVAAPEVNVKSADVNVNVEPPAVNIASPDIHVAAPEVTVQPADVHVAPTYVNIEPPDIQIPPSHVQVDVAAPEVKVNLQPSDVHVKAPDVHVAQPPVRKVRKTIERDALGLPIGIVEEEIEEDDPKKKVSPDR